MADLNCWPPPKPRELEREAAAHRLAACGAVLDRQPRKIEWHIEASDRGAKIIGPRIQHFIHEFCDGPQLVSALAAKPSKQSKLALADDARIIEEPGFVEFVAFAKLICADA